MSDTPAPETVDSPNESYVLLTIHGGRVALTIDDLSVLEYLQYEQRYCARDHAYIPNGWDINNLNTNTVYEILRKLELQRIISVNDTAERGGYIISLLEEAEIRRLVQLLPSPRIAANYGPVQLGVPTPQASLETAQRDMQRKIVLLLQRSRWDEKMLELLAREIIGTAAEYSLDITQVMDTTGLAITKAFDQSEEGSFEPSVTWKPLRRQIERLLEGSPTPSPLAPNDSEGPQKEEKTDQRVSRIDPNEVNGDGGKTHILYVASLLMAKDAETASKLSAKTVDEYFSDTAMIACLTLAALDPQSRIFGANPQQLLPVFRAILRDAIERVRTETEPSAERSAIQWAEGNATLSSNLMGEVRGELMGSRRDNLEEVIRTDGNPVKRRNLIELALQFVERYWESQSK
ncbi:MAG: hypothetical protein WCG83_06455 [Candidatus Peregrinibacteria bacterium]